MDKIWDRNPSKLEVIGRYGGDEKTNENPSKLEVIGRYGGDEKTNDHAELTKVNR